MEAAELRNFSPEELKARIKQWRDELFRARFKQQSSESKDTSVFKKLRKDIARGETILVQKSSKMVTAVESGIKEVSAAAKSDVVEEKVSKKSPKKKAAKREGVSSNGN